MIKTFIFISILLFSCNKDKHIKHYTLLKLDVVTKNQDLIKQNDKKSFNWEVPDNWIEGKKSSMRLASYSIPYDGELADVSISNFSGDGGGLQQNINRWRKQLELEPLSFEMIEKMIEVKKSNLGNYKFIKIINTDNKDSAFLCSIMQIENSTIFIKLNATLMGAEKLESQFIDFCSSFK